ncbi:MAG: hypothetical protein KF774_14490 [Planctomyces sp.]|nr:hypothetical protein [Planctomyces sp.]
MAERNGADKLHLGFLRVVTLDAGYVGGLLVTNRIGRPLEFQCTTPVRPNRTQELLYGATLEGFLFTEVLGRTLFDRTAVKPDVLLIDQPALLAIREQLAIGVIQLPASSEGLAEAILDAAVLHDEHPGDRDWIERLRKAIPASADIREPLDRVQDALQEALRAAA